MGSELGELSAAWDDYLRWNDAVVEVIYPVNDDAMPAYMDLEAEELQMIARRAGYTGVDPRQAFAEAVRAVVVDGDGRFSLATTSPVTRTTFAFPSCSASRRTTASSNNNIQSTPSSCGAVSIAG